MQKTKSMRRSAVTQTEAIVIFLPGMLVHSVGPSKEASYAEYAVFRSLLRILAGIFV